MIGKTTEEQLKKLREEVIQKWKESGLLDGLTLLDKDSPLLKLVESTDHHIFAISREKIETTIESWEDKTSRMMAESDFHIMGRQFDKAKLIRHQIDTLNSCIDDLKKLIA